MVSLAVVTGRPSAAAPPTCENGIVVPDPEANRGLVLDCANLLAAKTLLDAPTPLNWGAETPIARWDGVTLGGYPPRVRELYLRARGFTGRVPPHLANVRELRELSLPTTNSRVPSHPSWDRCGIWNDCGSTATS